MFNLRRFGYESGIWQFHQAANVLGCRIQSVYPHLDVNLCNLRQDFHREIVPKLIANLVGLILQDKHDITYINTWGCLLIKKIISHILLCPTPT